MIFSCLTSGPSLLSRWQIFNTICFFLRRGHSDIFRGGSAVIEFVWNQQDTTAATALSASVCLSVSLCVCACVRVCARVCVMDVFTGGQSHWAAWSTAASTLVQAPLTSFHAVLGSTRGHRSQDTIHLNLTTDAFGQHSKLWRRQQAIRPIVSAWPRLTIKAVDAVIWLAVPLSWSFNQPIGLYIVHWIIQAYNHAR